MASVQFVRLFGVSAGFALTLLACGSATLTNPDATSSAGMGGMGAGGSRPGGNGGGLSDGSTRDTIDTGTGGSTTLRDGAATDAGATGAECRHENGQCVASVSGFALGIQVGSNSSCPSGFSTSQMLYAGLTNTGSCTCGSCAPGAIKCQASVTGFLDHDDFDCSGASEQSGIIDNTQTCNEFVTDSVIEIVGQPPSIGPCSPGVPTSTFGTSWPSLSKFCQADLVQPDCQGGICLAGGIACVLSAGDVACPAGYTKSPTSSYSGRTADQRTCICSCSSQGGDCSHVSVAGAGDPGCTGTDAFNPITWPAPGAKSACLNTNGSLYLTVAGRPTSPTCAGGSSVTGTGAQPTGMQTLCCAQ